MNKGMYLSVAAALATFGVGAAQAANEISAQPSSVKFEAFEQDPTGGVPTLVASNTVTCQKVK